MAVDSLRALCEETDTMKAGLLVVLVAVVSGTAARNLTFPADFMFGAGTSAYQVEGAWNISGKGQTMWDKIIHEEQAKNSSVETADVASDSYHHYKEDVQLLKQVGFDFYRFSISWSRVLPNGDLSSVNQDGIDYYNNLINEVIKNNLTPVVTMYHWDLPQHIQELGGLVNNIVVDYFVDYAELLFTHFGDRVKWWTTFNEPLTFVLGYGGSAGFAPRVHAPGVGPYLVGHNVLKAHARTYHLYHDKFASKQKGKVSITLNLDHPIPKTDSEADKAAVETYFQFNLGWFAHPIYSKEGDYPAIMKEMVAKKSKAEGLKRSRLPHFDEHWVKYIRGTFDFYGMNTYTSNLISVSNTTAAPDPIFNYDMGNLVVEQNSSWITGSNPNFRYTPIGMRKMLNWISTNYNNVPIFITENGWCDHGEMNDTMRIRTLVNYYAQVLDAIYLDKVKVLGFSIWALIDTFEWSTSSTRFGLFHVDFTDPARPRKAKDSVKVVANIIKTRKLPEEYIDKE